MSRRQEEIRWARIKGIAQGYQAGHSDGSHGWSMGFVGYTDEVREQIGFDPAAVETVRDRIKAEYKRHVPVYRPGELDLGNGVWSSGKQSLFACAADDCYSMWPCPTWHMLRRIDGSGTKTYRLSMVPVDQETK